MSTISDFKNCLAETVKQTTLNESKWKSETWKNAWCLINQDVLTNAFEQHAMLRSIFSGIGDMISRNCKSISRVEKKMIEQPTGRENYFKVVSDLVAVRAHCEVTEIQTKIDYIREIVLANGGQMHVRGSSNERPYGFFMNPEKKYTDITQYVYVFIEKIGYIVEMQIGHEFASHTFTIDSALRDNPNCNKVDLWSKDFYSDVKNYILAKANSTEHRPIAAIQEKALDLHQNNVPEDLQVILSKL